MITQKPKIGLFGIGAIGSVIAAALQSNKENIELLYFSRSPKSSIQLYDGETEHQFPITLQNTLTEHQRLNWLIVCIKTYHYDDALERLSRLIHQNAKVVVIRNGLRLKAPFLKFTPSSNILECIIDCPTQPMPGGGYQSLNAPLITTPDTDLARQFTLLFKPSKAEFSLVTDFKTASWKKVCESAALGAILCLSGETCWIFEDEKLRTLYIEILREGIGVARADGAKIDSTFEAKMLSKLLAYPKTKGSSMLTDRINGHPIELEAKNGIISALGAVHGIATPINDLIVKLLRPINRS